jgi:hypothetical protein
MNGIKFRSEADTCRSCGLLIPGKPYVAWSASRGKEIVDIRCRDKIHASGDDGYNGLYPSRYREKEIHDAIKEMRTNGASWQAIATALKIWPRTVRNIGVSLGLAVDLPGRSSHSGGGRKPRKNIVVEAMVEAKPRPESREPFPSGHPSTWGVISNQPWPGVMAS